MNNIIKSAICRIEDFVIEMQTQIEEELNYNKEKTKWYKRKHKIQHPYSIQVFWKHLNNLKNSIEILKKENEKK